MLVLLLLLVQLQDTRLSFLGKNHEKWCSYLNDDDQLIAEIRNAFVNMEPKRVNELLKKALDVNISPKDIVEKAFRQGSDEIGKKFEASEYFLPELILSGEMMKKALVLLKPKMRAEGARSSGKVIFGTVKGDLHDVGKNIVIAMMDVADFDVTDLDVDVPAERFVLETREKKPDILCMSTLLSHTMPQLGNVIEELKKAGLRDKVKVMVGGRPISQAYADKIGADAYGQDAHQAVVKAKELMKK
jgi:5-methyltetrahydrofolate--homocysteine methyltransferase